MTTLGTGKKRIIAAALAMAALVVIVVLRMVAAGGNDNALSRSLDSLAAADKVQVQRLMEKCVAGMPRNEESGLVFYKVAENGNLNRVFLLWEIVPPQARQRGDLAAALLRERRGADRDATLALVASVDIAFYSFRADYSLQLSRYFEARGVGGIHLECYRWEPAGGAWTLVGDIRDTPASVLLAQEQLLAAKQGTYNVVAIAE